MTTCVFHRHYLMASESGLQPPLQLHNSIPLDLAGRITLPTYHSTNTKAKDGALVDGTKLQLVT
jgi:hypothetical protein